MRILSGRFVTHSDAATPFSPGCIRSRLLLLLPAPDPVHGPLVFLLAALTLSLAGDLVDTIVYAFRNIVSQFFASFWCKEQGGLGTCCSP